MRNWALVSVSGIQYSRIWRTMSVASPLATQRLRAARATRPKRQSGMSPNGESEPSRTGRTAKALSKTQAARAKTLSPRSPAPPPARARSAHTQRDSGSGSASPNQVSGAAVRGSMSISTNATTVVNNAVPSLSQNSEFVVYCGA